jgi:cysteinyl-tRNA synthetase
MRSKFLAFAGFTTIAFNLLIEVRAEVRNQKLWALSDQICNKLKELNVTIEDSKDGTKWRW